MPEVSVIIPCFNEEKRINNLLTSLSLQTYPVDKFEVIIADGFSSDRTRVLISDFGRTADPKLDLHVVDNPKIIIPAALNKALEYARGEIIIRLDAHSVPQNDYLEKCVTLLRTGIADNVGGVWDIEPGEDQLVARAIAAAAAHPLGVGGANYRSQNARQGYVETVPFGAFFKKTLDQIGSYDETLLSNEDYELNARIIKNNGKIWLDPSIRCTYFSRTTLKKLAIQYWRYGYWKFQMLKRYPETLRFRQALPPLFLLSLLFFLFASIIYPSALLIFSLLAFLYGLSLFIGTSKSAFTQQPAIAFWIAMVLSIMTMHFSWGCAFIWAGIEALFRPGSKHQ